MKSRLQVGVDVPWVTAWTDEEMLGVRPDPALGRLVLRQAERPGEGRPVYSQNHLDRQRRSVREMLCPMCGRPTAPGDRWSQTATVASAGRLRARGLGHLLPPEDQLPAGRRVLNAGAVAPCHRDCAERALDHCPHLAGMPDKRLKAFPARWWVAPLTILAYPPPPAAGQAELVVTFLQLCGILA